MKKEDIKFDSRNYRIHDDRNKDLIAKSLDECGAGRSIVVDDDGEIIAGNGIYEAWGDRPVKVIESDGSELVVVHRTDLKRKDFRRDKLAIMDNSTSDSSKFDLPLLQTDFPDTDLLNEMGVTVIPISDIDVDSFFEDTEEKEKKKKTVKCPNCGEEFEI
jgi:hypothetical protein